MTKLTVQLNKMKRCWSLAIDGKYGEAIPDINGSLDSGRLTCQRQLAQEILKQMPNYPERAHRIAYLTIELAIESNHAISISPVVDAHPGLQIYT